MDTQTQNEDRSRHYGLRIGDIVKAWGTVGEVKGFDFGDNNSAYLLFEGDEEVCKTTAEECEILISVENR